MVLAGGRLFVAGPEDAIDEDDPYATFEGRGGAILQVFSATDGALVKSHPLPSTPVFDGMSAAGGRLYVSTKDRKLVCLGQASRSDP
jgi:hypothetical protein